MTGAPDMLPLFARVVVGDGFAGRTGTVIGRARGAPMRYDVRLDPAAQALEGAEHLVNVPAHRLRPLPAPADPVAAPLAWLVPAEDKPVGRIVPLGRGSGR